MAQLKEGSVIRKPTGDEIIATIDDVPTKISELDMDINVGGGIKTITSPTEPTLSVGDQWHKEI